MLLPIYPSSFSFGRRANSRGLKNEKKKIYTCQTNAPTPPNLVQEWERECEKRREAKGRHRWKEEGMEILYEREGEGERRGQYACVMCVLYA